MPVWASTPAAAVPAFPRAPGQERDRQAGAAIPPDELWIASQR